MGWFLSKNNKRQSASKKSSRKTARKTASHEPWDRERTLQGLKWIVSLGVIIALVAGFQYSERALIERSTSQGHFIASDQVELVNCPAWLAKDVQRDISWIVAGQVSADPFDETALNQAAKALAANPWVKSVDFVERGKSSLKVHATYRQPAALVQLPRTRKDHRDYLRNSDTFYPVDTQGYRLPTNTTGHFDEPFNRKHAAHLNLPLIVGVTSAPPAAGERWDSDAIESGLALVKLLVDKPYAKQIVAYDVAARDTRDRIRLQLHTANGLVRWGLPPGEEVAVEPKTPVKLRWLAFLHMENGSIDVGGKVIDIFGPGPSITNALDSVYIANRYNQSVKSTQVNTQRTNGLSGNTFQDSANRSADVRQVRYHN